MINIILIYVKNKSMEQKGGNQKRRRNRKKKVIEGEINEKTGKVEYSLTKNEAINLLESRVDQLESKIEDLTIKNKNLEEQLDRSYENIYRDIDHLNFVTQNLKYTLH